MFCSIHSFDLAGDIFHPELHVLTTSTTDVPRPSMAAANALRSAVLALRTAAGVCTA